MELGTVMGEPVGVGGYTHTHTHQYTPTHNVGVGFGISDENMTRGWTHHGFHPRVIQFRGKLATKTYDSN
jgi:hypothetical protein